MLSGEGKGTVWCIYRECRMDRYLCPLYVNKKCGECPEKDMAKILKNTYGIPNKEKIRAGTDEKRDSRSSHKVDPVDQSVLDSMSVTSLAGEDYYVDIENKEIRPLAHPERVYPLKR